MAQSTPPTNTTPFFIVGSGRSGSTLLRMILSGHSRVAIPPETWYLLPLVELLPLSGALSCNQIDKAIEIMTQHYRWPDLKIDAQEFARQVHALENPTLRDILDVVYRQKIAEEKKEIWGDKTPPYVEIIPQLHRLYPEAKFLHLVRDGRDVTKSFHTKGWYGPWLFSNTREWKRSINLYEKYNTAEYSTIMMNVRYEDLVLDTEETVRKICLFLRLEFEPSMLEWQESVKNKVPERELHIHTKLFRKPKESDIFRWRHELSSIDVFAVESFIADELIKSGYELRFANIFWKPIFKLSWLYCMTVVPTYSFFKRATLFFWKKVKTVG